jgi:hypothetical protein
VFFSMTASTAADIPRGIDFLLQEPVQRGHQPFRHSRTSCAPKRPTAKITGRWSDPTLCARERC